MEGLEPAFHRLRIGAVEVDLGPVARRQDRRLLHMRLREQIAQRRAQRVDMKRYALPHRDRRGRVIETKGVQSHGTIARA